MAGDEEEAEEAEQEQEEEEHPEEDEPEDEPEDDAEDVDDLKLALEEAADLPADFIEWEAVSQLPIHLTPGLRFTVRLAHVPRAVGEIQRRG